MTGYSCVYSNQCRFLKYEGSDLNDFVLVYSQCIPSTLTVEQTPNTTTSAAADAIPRATYTEITNFGKNPTNVRAWIYIPQSLATKPPIVVGIHWCHGDANAFYTGTNFKSLADQKGFIMIYPQTQNSDGCWDVHTTETLT